MNPADAPDLVLVVDFGAQYAQLIARGCARRGSTARSCRNEPVEDMLARKPKAIILSGGPSSVYAPGAPQADPALFDGAVPTLGICYGFQAMALTLGGTVAHTGRGEYGGTPLRIVDAATLFHGLPAEQSVWMSHGDSVVQAPAGFTVTAVSNGSPVAAFEDAQRRLYGIQFHPEVLHTPHGQQVLERFLYEGAGCRPTWTMVNIVDSAVDAIRAQIGDKRVVCGLSGGVDSAVAAALVQRAVGDRLTCVFVDHGLLRKGEAEQVERDYVAATGVQLHVVEAHETFLKALAGVTEPEDKRKIIGREFIRTFEQAARDVVARGASTARRSSSSSGHALSDVVESGGGKARPPSSRIQRRWAPDDLAVPARRAVTRLFKDECAPGREELGLPQRSCTASRSPDRASGSASSAR